MNPLKYALVAVAGAGAGILAGFKLTEQKEPPAKTLVVTGADRPTTKGIRQLDHQIVRDVYRDVACAGMPVKRAAAKHGISSRMVSHIVTMDYYADVTADIPCVYVPKGSRLVAGTVHEIEDLIVAGMSVPEICQRFGLTAKEVMRVVKGNHHHQKRA